MKLAGKLISNSVHDVDLLVIICHLKLQFCSLMHGAAGGVYSIKLTQTSRGHKSRGIFTLAF